MGDAVYELGMRTMISTRNRKSMKDLHLAVANLTNAAAQARIVRELEDYLNEEEMEIVRKGRNAKSQSYPRNVGIGDYRLSTGFEAMIGFLYLNGKTERLQEIFHQIMNIDFGSSDS
ncbi:MAG: Mini-ribonuclease 3 [Chitinophagales bacterium]